MGDTGTELGVDCYELYDAGHNLYPAIASEFDACATEFSASSSYNAFVRDSSIGLGYSGAYSEWSAAANTLDNVLAETGRHLRDTGQALMLAANTYAATDAAAQAEYDRRKRELG